MELDFDERMELHHELYQAAVDLMTELGMEPAVDAEMRRRLLRATELLERVLGLRPDNWNAMWALGYAWRQLGDRERAYDAFGRAYALDPPDPDVARELCAECLALGKGVEAVAAARRACELDPGDAGLIANLALSYLIAGQIEAASTTIGTARERDPQDSITENLALLIGAVERHEIEAPTRWPPEGEDPGART